MADMARGRLRTKIPAQTRALTGNFGEHHAFLWRLPLTRIDEPSATIEELSARIDAEMRPFAHQFELLVTIPGVKKSTAEVIIAETGADMTRFRTAAAELKTRFQTHHPGDLMAAISIEGSDLIQGLPRHGSHGAQ
jgi:transposase